MIPRLLAVLGGLLISSPVLAEADIANSIVKLQGLDKITARVEVFEIGLEQELLFGTLSIVAHACYETPPTEPPESVAFLEVRDTENDESNQIFNGWMFASSPALSALEHPVYDIWVLDCLAPLDDDPLAEESSNG